jgi:hypothetical protein
MPWQPLGMRTRVAAFLSLLLLVAACDGSSGDDEPGSGRTSDADCATRIPDSVFDTLRWSPPKAAESTVRGCHRETEQGYVEVRDRSGYDQLCQTLDRSGGTAPGRPVDWLDGRTACAVEPAGGLGATKVVVKEKGDLATEVTVAALTSTDQSLVRAVVDTLTR